ncbi:MAG TPA: hypothetical protein VKA55_07975 [Gammaproteobacteria bacterium]|nr:hypothetical protein [Gammaproteobacteria bacterium]
MTATKRLSAATLAALAALVLGAGPALAASADQARAKVEKARNLVSEVRAKSDGQALWKSTRKILGNAEQSLAQGDYDAAASAADKAIFQARKGLAQYREQQEDYGQAADAASHSGQLDEKGWTEGDG